ncbi:TspO/MBR family protein [Blastomonas sp.]|uniref:TspO/MBR family protein n=1 Tax=Blastomonas sp. TaxID=1909299 RepID=UPI0026102355|nr:TspO/MBR family protein [Blastomonas sp.]MDM7957657.1 TspO/MBR family protein [Blastomonas sp.]
MHREGFLPVILAAMAALIVAAGGATITDLGPWYQRLTQPDWAPPNWLYGVAWTLIFALAAMASLAAWRAAPTRNARTNVIGLFAFNGFLNVLWSLLFFRVQRPDWALIEVAALWLSVAVLIVYCGRFSKATAWLLLPYIAWVSVAAALNYGIVQLNGPFG